MISLGGELAGLAGIGWNARFENRVAGFLAQVGEAGVRYSIVRRRRTGKSRPECSQTMKSQPRKRRTREHVIADLSVNHVERHALLCGYTLERFRHDYGIDLVLFTYSPEGEVEDECVFLQLKASDGLRLRPGQKTFSFRIERRDLVYWLGQMLPVILIVYDGRKELAYWLYVQSYFQKRHEFNLFTAGKMVTLEFPTTNVVDAGAFRRFARFRDRVIAQKNEVIHEEE